MGVILNSLRNMRTIFARLEMVALLNTTTVRLYVRKMAVTKSSAATGHRFVRADWTVDIELMTESRSSYCITRRLGSKNLPAIALFAKM
jgi:hypothetical protein